MGEAGWACPRFEIAFIMKHLLPVAVETHSPAFFQFHYNQAPSPWQRHGKRMDGFDLLSNAEWKVLALTGLL